MGLSNKKYSYDQLGEINQNGIDVAKFPQIRDAIADRMKQIYGDDIDLSTASADGQYINMEALILDNVYKLLSNLYNNLNPYVAGGKYLDILCSLTNIRRKSSSYSTAQVYVKNVGTSAVSDGEIRLIDRDGNEWVWTNPLDLNGLKTITIQPDDIMNLIFTCTTAGPVEAYANPDVVVSNPYTDIDWNATDFTNGNGDIYKTVNYGTYKVYQAADAEIGSDEESDSSLRTRRNDYLASNSTTTQAGLEAALFNLESLVDVYVLNNVTGASKEANDGVSVDNHNVYIVLRYKDGITVNEDDIGQIIYDKLTPGVNTQAYASPGTGGENRESEINLSAGVTTIVNWKKCIPVHPDITINFTVNKYYIKGSVSTGKSEFELAIQNGLINYLNGIAINEILASSNILTTVNNADLRPNGYSSFYTTSCVIDNEGTDVNSYRAPLTYYDYKEDDFTFSYDDDEGTITISRSLS